MPGAASMMPSSCDFETRSFFFFTIPFIEFKVYVSFTSGKTFIYCADCNEEILIVCRVCVCVVVCVCFLIFCHGNTLSFIENRNVSHDFAARLAARPTDAMHIARCSESIAINGHIFSWQTISEYNKSTSTYARAYSTRHSVCTRSSSTGSYGDGPTNGWKIAFIVRVSEYAKSTKKSDET